VIVDATFAEERQRRTFLDLARSLCVPVVWFVCRASPACVRDRLAARSGDASDADWAIYETMRRDWELEGDASRRARIEVDTEPGAERAVARACEELVTRRLS
jgi:predicted kinase